MRKSILITALFLMLSMTACSSKSKGGDVPIETEIITENLFTLGNECDMSVTVKYNAARPDVAFVQPDEVILNEKTVSFENGDGAIKYFLPNAMPGDWQICYDQKDNTDVQITYESYLDKVKITNFTLGTVSDGQLPVKFTIESKTGGTCLYKLYAYNENVTDVLLIEGSANLNNEFSKIVDTNILTDGGYKIRLEVVLKYGEEVQTANQIAQAFILTVKNIIQ